MTDFYFNKDYARPIEISKITPNGIIYFKNGRRASFKRKNIREIKKILPPLEEFNSEIFQEIKNEFVRKGISQAITGRIIFNLYHCNLEKKLEDLE